MKVFKRKLVAVLAAVATAMGFTSCSLVNDDSDCVDSFNIFEFHYEHNLKFSDAFDPEVKSVTLLGFDESGTLVHMQRGDSRTMEVRMKPGKYNFLVWAGDYDTHFSIAAPQVGKSKLTDFSCVLKTEPTHPDSPEGSAHSSLPLENLFHALKPLELGYASPSAPAHHDLYLTKDTNSIRVMLQQQNAESALSAGDFIFEIDDRNAHLNHDNSLHADPTRGLVTYHPHYLGEGSTEYNPGEKRADGNDGSLINVVLAEFTTSRLHTDYPTTLRVRLRDGGKTLFSIPLQDYALMIRSEKFSSMDPQEFLDRQDEYSLTFILDENQKWIAVEIIVNDWRLIKYNVAAS